MEKRRPRGIAALWQAYEDWRFRRDFTAIISSFNRLSDRQLGLLGLTRNTLFETVEDMILTAERERVIGREVAALLEGPVETSASIPLLGGTPAENAEVPQDLRAA
jgi:uncharacterized protein YjiS (DUF1127 family)